MRPENWKWTNVPIPAQYVLALLAGAVLQLQLGGGLFRGQWLGTLVGLPLVAGGVGLAAWSVLAAHEVDIEAPDQLLTAGPYSLSRNPMYLGWTLFYLGVALAVNSLWIALLFPLPFLMTHFIDIRKEERYLEAEFGDRYVEYRRRVCRYL